MDSDSANEWVANGDGRMRRNILVSGDEANGILVNMLGNERPINYSDVVLNLSYCYRVIGSYYNRLQRAVYYLVFSLPWELESGGASSSTTTSTTTTTESGDLDIDYTSGTFEYDNMLLRYWEDTRTIDVIFRDRKNYLGLHYDYPMKDMTMIGNWLYFTPRVSEPKFIDVEMAYNYTNYDKYDPTLTYVYGDYVTYYGGLFRASEGVGVGETPVTTEAKWERIGDSYQDETTLSYDSEFRYAFNVIKLPPVTRPSIAYGTDTSINSNNVRGRVFRFSYRYKYFDDSYSVYSAYSDVSLPLDDEQWNGEVLDEVNSNNYIAVEVNLHSAALVKSVEIVFQTTGGDWRRCKIVNRREQAELTESNFAYNFYNNEAYEVYADPVEILKIHDSVPLKANSQEIINKNILCYGGVTEGFDNIPKEDIDVTLTPVLGDIAEIFDEANLLRDNVDELDWEYVEGEIDDSYPYPAREYYRVLDVNDYAAWGVVDGAVLRLVANGTEIIITFDAADVVSAEAIANAVYDGFTHSYLWIDQTHNVDGEIWIGDLNMYPRITVSRFYIPDTTATALSKYKGFKTGAFHPFCIFYYDESMRRCDAQTSKISVNSTGYTYEGTTVYVPMFTEVSPAVDESHRWTIDWTVDHLPPDYAKFWRFGYAGNSLCSYFVKYIIEDIDDGTGSEVNMTYLDITPLQTLKDTAEATWNQYPASNIDAYTWEKGDRVRFLTEEGDPTVPDTDMGSPIEGVYDFEIIKQDTTNNRIYVQKFNHIALSLGECSLIEIYRPLKETTKETFYEFGDIMPIVYDSDGVKVHGGITTTQDTLLGTVASGTFNSGDVYHIFRTPSKPLDDADTDQGAFHESMWWSDFYESDDWDKGKAGVESNFGERYLNIIRYSNQYLQNTAINGLSTFDALNYKELNDVFGDVVAIYELGNTLKCYQERKASSVLIGRTEYNDADGNATVAISTSVLGAVRYSTTNFSTVFPECISRNNRFIYGFDIYNGVVFRDTANGIFPISGRYAEAGSDFDYKMSHYFKDKSKALLESGIDHCDVMSVWDEEFKNLYLIFKDYVNEDNNETIVFHEPSNRWICFMDLEQTPPYHNEFLECTYEITKGFEGGLGYWFDEDTRFAMFDIVSPGNRSVSADTISMAMTVNDPTVSSEGEGSQELLGMTMTIYTPTILITSLYANVYSMAFAYDDDDITDASEYQDALITCTESVEPFTVDTSEVSWMGYRVIAADGVTNITGNPALWGDGCYVRFCPNSTNGGGERDGLVYIRATGVAAHEISVTQQATPSVVNVRAGNDAVLSISDGSGNVIGGLNIEFTPHYVPTPVDPQFDVCWLIKVNDVEAYSSLTTGIPCNQDIHENLISIDYGSATWTDGDVIDVYLYYEEAPALT